MQITGSRGLPEPGGSRGSTDRKAYKAVSLSPGRLSLSLSLSSPPGGSPVVSPSAHARALAPATVTAPYISRGSGGGGGTGVTSTDIKVVLARAGVRSPTLVEIFDFYDTRRERTAEARRGGGGGANSTDREGKREKEREQDRTSLVPATVFTSYSLPHSPPIAPLFFPLSLSLYSSSFFSFPRFFLPPQASARRFLDLIGELSYGDGKLEKWRYGSATRRLALSGYSSDRPS